MERDTDREARARLCARHRVGFIMPFLLLSASTDLFHIKNDLCTMRVFKGVDVLLARTARSIVYSVAEYFKACGSRGRTSRSRWAFSSDDL